MLTREEFQAKVLRTVPESIRERVKDHFARSEEDRERDEEKQAEDCRRSQNESWHKIIRANCGLSGDEWENTFAGYNPQTPKQRTALAAARRFAANYPNLRKGLAFYGNAGVGKDGLLHGIVNELLTRGKPPILCYYYALHVEKAMHEEWRGHSEEVTAVEDHMACADVLLLGDLHNVWERVRSDAVKNAFWRVLDQASATGKPLVCFTTNYAAAWFDEIDSALGSRLARCCEWFEVDGLDRRREG